MAKRRDDKQPNTPKPGSHQPGGFGADDFFKDEPLEGAAPAQGQPAPGGFDPAPDAQAADDLFDFAAFDQPDAPGPDFAALDGPSSTRMPAASVPVEVPPPAKAPPVEAPPVAAPPVGLNLSIDTPKPAKPAEPEIVEMIEEVEAIDFLAEELAIEEPVVEALAEEPLVEEPIVEALLEPEVLEEEPFTFEAEPIVAAAPLAPEPEPIAEPFAMEPEVISGVAEVEEIEEIAEIVDDEVIAAEPAPSAIGSPQSDVFAAEFLDMPLSPEATPTQPTSTKPPSDVFAAEYLRELSEGKQGSEVVIADTFDEIEEIAEEAPPPPPAKPAIPVAKPIVAKPVTGTPIAGIPVAGVPVAGVPIVAKPVAPVESSEESDIHGRASTPIEVAKPGSSVVDFSEDIVPAELPPDPDASGINLEPPSLGKPGESNIFSVIKSTTPMPLGESDVFREAPSGLERDLESSGYAPMEQIQSSAARDIEDIEVLDAEPVFEVGSSAVAPIEEPAEIEPSRPVAAGNVDLFAPAEDEVTGASSIFDMNVPEDVFGGADEPESAQASLPAGPISPLSDSNVLSGDVMDADVFEGEILEGEAISGTSRKSEVVLDLGDSDVVAAEVREVSETDTGRKVLDLAQQLSSEDILIDEEAASPPPSMATPPIVGEIEEAEIVEDLLESPFTAEGPTEALEPFSLTPEEALTESPKSDAPFGEDPITAAIEEDDLFTVAEQADLAPKVEDATISEDDVADIFKTFDSPVESAEVVEEVEASDADVFEGDVFEATALESPSGAVLSELESPSDASLSPVPLSGVMEVEEVAEVEEFGEAQPPTPLPIEGFTSGIADSEIPDLGEVFSTQPFLTKPGEEALSGDAIPVDLGQEQTLAETPAVEWDSFPGGESFAEPAQADVEQTLESTASPFAAFDPESTQAEAMEDLVEEAPISSISGIESIDEVVEIDSDSAIDELVSTAEPTDEGSAVDLGRRMLTDDRPSGIDPLAEALESGVNLGRSTRTPSPKKQSIEPEDVDLSDLFDDAEPAETIKPRKGKPAAKSDDEATFAIDADEAIEEFEEVAEVASDVTVAPSMDVMFDDDLLKDATLGSKVEEAEGIEEVVDEATAADVLEGDIDEVIEEEIAEEVTEGVDEEIEEIAEAADDEEITETAEEVEEFSEVGEATEEDAAFDALMGDADETIAATADDEPVATFDEEPEPVRPAGRGKRSRGFDDEFDSMPVTRPPEPPKYGRRWMGGLLLGTLLLGGAGAGIWYQKPELVQDLLKSSPNFQPVAEMKPLQKARVDLGDGKYNEALAALQNADANDPSAVGLRGEARWMKYLADKTAAKLPVSKDDPEVQQALTDLKAANKDLVIAQVQSSLDQQMLKGQVDQLAEKEKSAGELKDILVKSNLADAKADWKDLAAAVDMLVKSRKSAEDKVDGVAKALVDTKIIEAKDQFDVVAFGKIVADLTATKAGADAINKMLEKADIKEAGEKGVEKLLASWKDTETRLGDVNKLLADAKLKDEGAKGVKELVDSRTRLEAERDQLENTLQTAFKELVEAQVAVVGADPRKEMVAATKIIRQKAESPLVLPLASLASNIGAFGTSAAQALDKALENTAMAGEVNYFRMREPLIQSPAQKLDPWIAFFQDRTRNEPAEAKTALKDTAWLLGKEAKSSPEVQGKAYLVNGLVSRNLEQFDDARASLKSAVDLDPASKQGWSNLAKRSLDELTDPTKYFLPRADQLQSEGNTGAALAVLSNGLKALPNDGRLLAQRGLIRLELGAGRLDPASAKVIRDDAEVASKDAQAAAVAAFVLGRVEEETGNFAQAEQLYRQALKIHQGPASGATRYLFALARILQRDRAANPAFQPKAAPKEAPKEDKKENVGLNQNQDGLRGWITDRVAQALLGAQPGFDDEEDPVMAARIKESIEIAKQLLASEDAKVRGQGHLILGKALSKQGKRSEGLREYLRGLELLYPGETTRDLTALLNEHPAFQLQDGLTRPNPYLAEQHFGQGLHYYFSRQYPEAEAQFKQAAGFFDQDARYLYFLGLSQVAQKQKQKRDAALYNLEKASRLEALGRPTSAEVNASLERIQGELRIYLNGFRQKAQ